VPQDEAYRRVSLGFQPVGGNSAICSNLSIHIPPGWGAVPPPPDKMEIRASIKFTGPTCVAGWIQPEQVLIDRIVILPPQEP